jgi:hypothetical protein
LLPFALAEKFSQPPTTVLSAEHDRQAPHVYGTLARWYAVCVIAEGMVDSVESEGIMSPRTTFLSKLIGLYLILISLAMTAHKQATVELMNALVHNAPVLFVVGVIAVTAGLAMVLGHDVWSGGVLPVVVTLTGWLILIKGSMLVFLSPGAVYGTLVAGFHFEQLFYLYMSAVLLLGIYLTYAGFRAAAR